MCKKLNDIDIKIIKFILTGSAYSEEAIIKNIGITKEELQKSYETLTKKGYLETYDDYQKREQEGCASNCSTCSKKSGACAKCGHEIDYTNIKVITWKAIDEFDE